MIASNLHYVLLPPSVHPDGDGWQYQWRNREPASIDDFPVLNPFDAGLCDAVRTHPDTESDPAAETRTAASNTNTGVLDFKDRLNDWKTRPNDVYSILAATVPRRTGERNARLWDLARFVKSLPEFEGAGADDAKDVFDAWMESARHVVRTKDEQYNWEEFRRMWEGATAFKIRPMVPVIELPVAAICARYRNRQYHRVIAHAAKLQSGQETFYLGTCKVESSLGIPRSTASSILKRLVADGVLEVVKKHQYRKDKPLATEYRFA